MTQGPRIACVICLDPEVRMSGSDASHNSCRVLVEAPRGSGGLVQVISLDPEVEMLTNTSTGSLGTRYVMTPGGSC